MSDRTPRRTSRLTVLVFTDIVGSTDLKSRLGLADFTTHLERHNYLFESIAAGVQGAEILKHTGDGYMATVPTASEAVRLALQFQRAFSTEPWSDSAAIETRIGIHLGEVSSVTMAGRPDVVGIAADLAARVMSLAGPRQVLLTKSAFDNARQYAGTFTDLPDQPRWLAHGDYLFKGTDEPVEIFEVGLVGLSPLAPPVSSEKTRRVVPHLLEETLGWRPAAGLDIPDRPGWSLIKKLGDGGFGEVWLGAHTRTHENRVFKFCFDADRLRSFKREMTLFRLLREALGDRDDIARLHEVKLDKAPFFLESDYTTGGNLIDWSTARGGISTLPLDQRLTLFAEVSDAVAAAHSVGILHKDIKPSNILIEPRADGTVQPRLADFGIGLLADRKTLERLGITETGFDTAVVTASSSGSQSGTRLYAPPELLAGKPFTVQGDIYALGILLYQLVVADLARPLAAGWERDVDDDLLRADIAACVDGDPSRRLSSPIEIATRIRTLPERRERKRLADAAARSAARRLQLVRNSIAAVSVLIVLLLVVAGGSFFYIRKIRAARADEAAQRTRAEDSERVARDSAESAQREAAHSKAQYLLAQKLVRPAFKQACRAAGPGSSLDDRLLLAAISAVARSHWSLIGQVPAPAVANVQGCFVLSKPPIFVLPRRSNLETYSIPDGTPLKSEHLPANATQVAPLSDSLVIVASGPNLEIRDVHTLAVTAHWKANTNIRQISVRPGIANLAVLDMNGAAVILSASDLSERARFVFPFPLRQPIGAPVPPNIDLSPTGKLLLAHSGIWTEPASIWDWASTKVPALNPNFYDHMNCFMSDSIVAGLATDAMGLDTPNIRVHRLLTPASATVSNSVNSLAKSQSRIYAWPTDAPESSDIDPRLKQPDIDPFRISIVGSDGIDIINPATGHTLSNDRFDSLWPVGHDDPVLAAYAPAEGLLAVTFGQRTLLFESAQQSEQRSGNFRISFWSICSTPAAFWNCDPHPGRVVEATGPEIDLLRHPYHDEQPRTFVLQWPAAKTDLVAVPWGIWITPDERLAAVVWQEAENTSIGSKYFRKSILIYDLSTTAAGPLPIVRNIPMPDLDALDGRSNRRVVITPDHSTVLFAPTGGKLQRFRLDDASRLSDLDVGNSYDFSNDGALVAGGSLSRPGPVTVWNIASGEKVFTTPEAATVGKLCFSTDSKTLAVSWDRSRLQRYDLATGSSAPPLQTKLLPVAVPTTGDQFIAFLPDSAAIGNMVLANIKTGDTSLVLNTSAHVLNLGFFSPDGNCIAIGLTRYSAEMWRSFTPEAARESIARLSPSRYTDALPALASATLRTIPLEISASLSTSPTSTADSINVTDTTRLLSLEGANVSVAGRVATAQWNPAHTVLLIDFEDVDHDGFYAVAFPKNTPKIERSAGGDLTSLLPGKSIKLTGPITLYNRRPEIILNDPDQLTILAPQK